MSDKQDRPFPFGTAQPRREGATICRVCNAEVSPHIARYCANCGAWLNPLSLETALCEVACATDGQGRKIKLYSGDNSASSIRKTIVQFACMNEGFEPVFLDGFTGQPSLTGEMAYWRNLALLCRALEAAIDHEMKANEC